MYNINAADGERKHCGRHGNKRPLHFLLPASDVRPQTQQIQNFIFTTYTFIQSIWTLEYVLILLLQFISGRLGASRHFAASLGGVRYHSSNDMYLHWVHVLEYIYWCCVHVLLYQGFPSKSAWGSQTLFGVQIFEVNSFFKTFAQAVDLHSRTDTRINNLVFLNSFSECSIVSLA